MVIMEKGDVEHREHTPRKLSASGRRRGSFAASVEDAISTAGRRASDARDFHYVDHREGDDRADAAKGRDSAAMKDRYWYSANFIGTLLAIGFSFMAGIGGKTATTLSKLFRQVLTTDKVMASSRRS